MDKLARDQENRAALHTCGRLLGALCLFLCASVASARLHTGEVRLYLGDAWDFSDSSNGNFQSYDIVYEVTAFAPGASKGSIGARSSSMIDMVHAYSGITYIGYADSVYEKLAVAPTDPGLYVSDVAPYPEEVYVVQTREGHYAKIAFLYPDGAVVKFKYTYQDDGSPSFLPLVATQTSTWGRVKSLFR